MNLHHVTIKILQRNKVGIMPNTVIGQKIRHTTKHKAPEEYVGTSAIGAHFRPNTAPTKSASPRITN